MNKLEDYVGSVDEEAAHIDSPSGLAVQADIPENYKVPITIRSRRYRLALRNKTRLLRLGHLFAPRGTRYEVTRMP